MISAIRNLILRALVAFLFVLSVVGGPVAQTAEPSLPPQIAGLIERVSREQSTVQLLLERYGFPPPDWRAEDWRGIDGMPASESVEFAWRAAERAELGSGDQLLGRIHSDYAEVNPLFRLDPDGRGLPRSDRRAFAFAALTAADISVPLPPHVERFVTAIGRHADGGLRGHLGRCCSVPEERVRRILRSARTPQEAIRLVLQEGTLPPLLRQRLAVLLESIFATNPAFATDIDLSPLREEMLRNQERAASRVSAVAEEGLPTSRLGAQAALIDAALRAEFEATMHRAQVSTPQSMTLGRHVVSALDAPTGEVRSQSARRDVDPIAAALEGREPNDSPPPMLGPGSSPGGGDGVGGGGGGGGSFSSSTGNGGAPRSMAAANRAFDLRQYGPAAMQPGAPARAFNSVSVRAAGRGGVMFGNEVNGTLAETPAVSVSWMPLEQVDAAALVADTPGTFRIRLSDDRVLYSPVVTASAALAAARIAFTGIPGLIDRHHEGEEIGLAGIAGRFPLLRVDGGRLSASRDTGGERVCTHFVVNPAIADTPVGRAAIVVDALLMGWNSAVLTAILAESAVGADGQAILAKHRQEARGANTYKFVDRRLTIVFDEKTSLIRAVGGTNTNDYDAPRLAINWLQFIDQTLDPRPEIIATSLPLAESAMRVLRDASREVALLDSFAEHVAILRWAASTGAVWLGGVSERSFSDVHTTLCRVGTRFSLGGSRGAIAAQTVDDVAAEGDRILAFSGAGLALAHLNARTQRARTQLVRLGSLGDLFDLDLARQATAATGLAAEPGLSRAIQTYRQALSRSPPNLRAISEARAEVLALGIRSEVPEFRIYASIRRQRDDIWLQDPGRTQPRAILQGLAPNLDPAERELLSEAEAELARAQTALADGQAQLNALSPARREALQRGREQLRENELPVLLPDDAWARWQLYSQRLAGAEGRGDFISRWYWSFRRYWLDLSPDQTKWNRLRTEAEQIVSVRRSAVSIADRAAAGAVLPGFSAWHDLQRSFASSCPTGICSE